MSVSLFNKEGTGSSFNSRKAIENELEVFVAEVLK